MDYEALGLKVGLEIHQQIDTHKLFCNCPSDLSDADSREFTRTLRPTRSEMGEVDRAALSEAKKHLNFRYQAPDSVCLVEADEEPPHEANQEAIDMALEFASMVGSEPVDEVQFMRKIVIDGSNTSGFQRTALVATGGELTMDVPGPEESGTIGISTICLEEDAARRVEKGTSEVTYRLDRLGIPLIEVATEPDIVNPAQARAVAERLGNLLRATKKVKRGIGTIREDLNISIAQGARVEIKGIQQLNMIDQYVRVEVARQLALVEAKRELARRGVTHQGFAETMDVTELVRDSDSRIIKKKIEDGGIVLGIRLKGYGGLLGDQFLRSLGIIPGDSQIKPERMRILGPEMADHVRTMGVKGLFHSDELPGYGITKDDVGRLRKVMDVGHGDAFVLIAEERDVAQEAGDIVIARAAAALNGVPKETRDPLPDGTSSFSRPLAGEARMYPETDVPPIRITAERMEGIRAHLPEMPEHRRARFVGDYGLSPEQAIQLINAGNDEIFELLMDKHDTPGMQNIIARMLLSTLPELESEGVHIPGSGGGMLDSVLSAVEQGKFAKEGIPRVLRHMIENGVAVEEAARTLGLETMDRDEIERVIDAIIEKRMEFIREKGMDAVGPLMGPVMKELRGKVDGKTVNETLGKRISDLIN